MHARVQAAREGDRACSAKRVSSARRLASRSAIPTLAVTLATEALQIPGRLRAAPRSPAWLESLGDRFGAAHVLRARSNPASEPAEVAGALLRMGVLKARGGDTTGAEVAFEAASLDRGFHGIHGWAGIHQLGFGEVYVVSQLGPWGKPYQSLCCWKRYSLLTAARPRSSQEVLDKSRPMVFSGRSKSMMTRITVGFKSQPVAGQMSRWHRCTCRTGIVGGNC